jgi:hypothetical protein
LKRTARQTVDDITAIENAGKLEIYKLEKHKYASYTSQSRSHDWFLGTVVRLSLKVQPLRRKLAMAND